MDTIINITRNRNTYTIELDTGKQIVATFAPNFTVIGISGRPLISSPKQIDQTIGSAFVNSCNEHRDLPNRETVDRIISLPDIAITVKIFAIKCLFKNEFGGTHDAPAWKPLLKILRKWNERPNNLPNVDYLDRIVNNILYADTLDKYGLSEYVRLFPANLVSYVETCKPFREACKTAITDRYKKAQNAVKELLNMDDEDEISNRFGIHFTEYDSYNALRGVISKMTSIVRFLDELHDNEYEITNIDRDYATLESRVHSERTRLENERFVASQNEIPLEYENDRFKIFVPQSRADCAAIGNYFRNCVNTIAWNTYLARGERKLVIVCDKTHNNEWVICADIVHQPNGWAIRQYLEIGNRHPTNRVLLAFRDEYQQYLDNEINHRRAYRNW